MGPSVVLLAWTFVVYAIVGFGVRVVRDTLAYPTWEVCEAAREEVVKMLSPYEVSDRCEGET